MTRNLLICQIQFPANISSCTVGYVFDKTGTEPYLSLHGLLYECQCLQISPVSSIYKFQSSSFFHNLKVPLHHHQFFQSVLLVSQHRDNYSTTENKLCRSVPYTKFHGGNCEVEQGKNICQRSMSVYVEESAT